MQQPPINHVNSLPHTFTLPTTGRDRHLPPPGRAPRRVGARRLGRRPVVVDGGDGLPGAGGGAVSGIIEYIFNIHMYGNEPFPFTSST